VFHPTLTARAIETLAESPLGQACPLPLDPLPVDTCRAYAKTLKALWDPKKKQLARKLSTEEQAFVDHEQLLCAVDYRYWAERYAVILRDGNRLAPLTPFWASQEFTLDRLAAREWAESQKRIPDGVLMNVLKARQLGETTLSIAILSWRMTQHPHRIQLIAGDVPEQSSYMFGMLERILQHLPWFLNPGTIPPTNIGDIVTLANASATMVGAGKSMRGGLQDKGGEKSNLGRGKSQPLDEPVLTPYGWSTMGALRVGDLVVGADGRPTPVFGVFPQGMQPTYRVETSDGGSTRVSADHLWTVKAWRREDEAPETVTLTTQRLLDGGLRARNDRIWRYELPVVAPVAFIGEDLPLDAYVLGALLGDGSTRSSSIQLTCNDPGIADRVKAFLPDGYTLRLRKHPNRAPTYFVTWAERKGQRVHHVGRALRQLDLYGKGAWEKFIPDTYKFAPRVDRLKLLQGLLDTDGWIDKDGRTGFCTTSPQLAADVVFVVRSLGGVTTVNEKHPTYTYKGGVKVGRTAYHVNVTLPRNTCGFSLARKRDRYDRWEGVRKRNPRRTITKIDFVGYLPSQCIRVGAADALYVTNDFIVTHNTINAAHLSELSTWERPEGLDSSLFVALPQHPMTFAILESTAKGRSGWWPNHWYASEEGLTRFANLFIPWYIEPTKWRREPPPDWQPTQTTLDHATRVEKTSAAAIGRTMALDRDQLYWYESERAAYDRKDKLYEFFEEYPADAEEAFQHSGKSIFSPKVLDYLRNRQRPLQDCFFVQPGTLLASRQALQLQFPNGIPNDFMERP